MRTVVEDLDVGRGTVGALDDLGHANLGGSKGGGGGEEASDGDEGGGELHLEEWRVGCWINECGWVGLRETGKLGMKRRGEKREGNVGKGGGEDLCLCLLWSMLPERRIVFTVASLAAHGLSESPSYHPALNPFRRDAQGEFSAQPSCR